MPNLAQNLSFILLGEDRSASKTMTGAAAAAEKVTARIGGAFQKVGGIIGGEFGHVISTVGGGIDELGQKTQHLSTLLTVGGGVALTAGIGLQQFGSRATQATDQLNAAITATGAASTDYTERIEKAVKKNENLDHSAVDTKQALQVLTQATGDTGKALNLMGTVTDLAAAKHISLSDAALLVNRVLGGSGARTLVQFGVHMDGVGTKTEQGKRALAELAAKLDGQAKASVSNFGSQVDIVKTKVTDFAEEIAGPVGGGLTALGGVATATGLILDIYKAKQTAAAAATLAAAAAADVAAVSEDGLTVSTVALDTAMDANPIGLVAAALGILAGVAGGIALTSQRDLTGATDSYSRALERSNGLIDDNVKKQAVKALSDDGSLAAARKLGIASDLVVNAALGNKAAQAELTKELKAQTDAIDADGASRVRLGKDASDFIAKSDAVHGAVSTLTSAVSDQSSALSIAKQTYEDQQGALDALSGKVALTRAQYEALTKAIKGVPSLHVSSAGQVSYSDAKNSALGHAGGGDIMQTQYSLVGENGPEVVKLPGGSHVFPNGQGPTGGGGGMTFNITVHGAMDGNSTAKQIVTLVTNAARSGAIPKNSFSTALTGH